LISSEKGRDAGTEEAIHPSPIRAARRKALGTWAPNNKGGRGFCSGLGLMDICLITIDNNLNKSLQPNTAIGMLWLQTHFENDQWEALSNSTVIISEENSQLLVEDAKNAGLNVECFSDISMLDVFPKNN